MVLVSITNRNRRLMQYCPCSPIASRFMLAPFKILLFCANSPLSSLPALFMTFLLAFENQSMNMESLFNGFSLLNTSEHCCTYNTGIAIRFGKELFINEISLWKIWLAFVTTGRQKNSIRDSLECDS